MKYFSILVMILLVCSCRPDERDLQEIDQVLHLYIDSAGIDMLNSSLPGAYKAISLNDDYGITDNVPVSLNIKKNEESVYYIDYTAGATRKLISSADPAAPVYQSRITLAFIKPTSDSTSAVVNDTLVLNYVNSPAKFYLQDALYNKKKVFTNAGPGPHIIKVHK